MLTICSISSLVTKGCWEERSTLRRDPKNLTIPTVTQTRGEKIMFMNRRRGRAPETIPSGFSMATLLGSISPKITITTVVKATARRSPFAPISDNATWVATALAAMLTRLLPIRMTVRARGMSEISQSIPFLLLGFFSWIANSLPRPMEVIAVSLLLKKAEKRRRTARIRILRMISSCTCNSILSCYAPGSAHCSGGVRQRSTLSR